MANIIKEVMLMNYASLECAAHVWIVVAVHPRAVKLPDGSLALVVREQCVLCCRLRIRYLPLSD
jgi:hypothetical protein